jgi:hypothetical protein
MSGMCGNGNPFPTFPKGCTGADNCSFGLHQVDCCGSFVAIGFNHAYYDGFNQAEQSWEQTCPACGCAAQPTLAEDGRSCLSTAVVVSCDNLMCTTHCP